MKLVLNVTAAGLLAAAVILGLTQGRADAPKELEAEAKKLVQEKSEKYDPVREALERISKMDVKPLDWPQWGGSSLRNNTPLGKDIPTQWDVDTGKNILWQAQLGSQTYGNPIVANGHVYVGTNNAGGRIARYPWNNNIQIDLGCLLCFDEKTGDFLWQHSSPKLASGRVHDWPLQGICSTSYVDGERLWYVTSRGEVACLDTKGFRDGKNDGPYVNEPNQNKDEADVIWLYDMMGQLGTSQHNMCSCSVTCAGEILLVNTSNGLDESHINLPAPNAPTFIAMDRNTGKVLWTDKAPGTNILHGQWSSPTYAVLGGREQALFAGGDGWLYSFDPKGDGKGHSKLLWKFDANPKDSKWILGGRGTRNNLIATPVVYDGLVYVAVGQDPEHGEGDGHLWCVDPTGEGDVSSTLAQDAKGKPIPHRRIQAVDPNAGEKIVPNPKSKAVWHYSWMDEDNNGKKDFEELMHRSCGTVAIKDDLLFISDFSGLFHCLDAKKADKDGKPTVYWKYDMFAAAWGSPLIVEDKVYIGDEDGDVCIFELSKKQNQIAEINMGNSVYSTPIVANNVLYIANKNTLYAIGNKPNGNGNGK